MRLTRNVHLTRNVRLTRNVCLTARCTKQPEFMVCDQILCTLLTYIQHFPSLIACHLAVHPTISHFTTFNNCVIYNKLSLTHMFMYNNTCSTYSHTSLGTSMKPLP